MALRAKRNICSLGDLNDLLTKYNLTPGSSSDGIRWQIKEAFQNGM